MNYISDIKGSCDAFYDLVQRLKTMGYYAYTPKDIVESVVRKTLATCDIWQEATGRYYEIDCEELIEEGAGSCLEQLKPVLQRAGLEINYHQGTYDRVHGYSVIVNGSEVILL